MKTEALLTVLALLVLSPFTLKSQLINVSGRITDEVSGMCIPQLTVVEKNSGIGTLTTGNGSFSLLLHPGTVKLDFFSENYERSTITFDLKRDTSFQVNLSAIKADLGKKQKKEASRSAVQGEIANNPDPGAK